MYFSKNLRDLEKLEKLNLLSENMIHKLTIKI